MRKECTVCSTDKDESDYFYRDKSKKIRHSQCKDCYTKKRRDIWKKYYHKHGSKYRENAIKRNRKIKRRLRAKMLKYLEDKSCVKCGNNDSRVLEFDHINPKTKSFGIARGIADTLSWEKILIEMDECQILCANCHRIKTAKEQGWYKNTEV